MFLLNFNLVKGTYYFLIFVARILGDQQPFEDKMIWTQNSNGDVMSTEQLKKLCGFKMSTAKNISQHQMMSPFTDAHFTACQDISCLPKTFSWLDQKQRCPSLGQIADQKECGACWALAAAAVISDRHCLQTSEQRTFSAKEIASCAEGDVCTGGDPKEAMKYYVKNGVVTGGDPSIKGQHGGCQPYPAEKSPKMTCEVTCELNYSVPYNVDKRKGLSSYIILSKKIDEIKLDLMKFGPLVTTMDVYDDFRTYLSGIYKHVSNKLVAGHAVRLIGWGEENGTAYWLCANSFGEKWGMDGYFRIILGQNECQIENYLVGVEIGQSKATKPPIITTDSPATESKPVPVANPTESRDFLTDKKCQHGNPAIAHGWGHGCPPLWGNSGPGSCDEYCKNVPLSSFTNGYCNLFDCLCQC